MKIIDAHLHIGDLENKFASLYALAERLNYDMLTVLSLACAGRATQNLACAMCKLTHPEMTYAFGGFDYITKRDFLTQVKNIKAMGFDGIKILESKPTVRKNLKMAVNDPAYDECYSFMEETAFPVLLHVADPPEFWDKEKIPGWALEQGWFYDGSYEPFEQYYDEVEDMLAKHPKLRAIFAHFYFLSGEPERLQKFLDDHPSVSIDITAGIEMYENFSKEPAFWREFFVKNQKRIIFGTDSSDRTNLDDSDGKVALNGYAGMEIEFLRFNKEIEIFGNKLHGIGLPESAQERIFALNYLEFVDKTPRKINVDLVNKEIEFLRSYLKNESDIKDLDYIRGVIDAL